MKKLRVGVIGLGVGYLHIKGYMSHPMAEVVAVSDTNPKRLEERGKKELKIPSLYLSAEEMLAKEKLDIVSIATPNIFHKPLTIAALKAGCHVLCEKPLATNAKDAKEMVMAAKSMKKRLAINFTYRFCSQAMAMKREIEKGTMGNIYFARTVWHRRRGLPGFGGWFGQKNLSGGGPLIDLGVHRLDLALWFMNYPAPVWVMGSTYNYLGSDMAKKQNKKFDVEDFATGMIKFEDGAVIEIESSWASNIKEEEHMKTRLLGTKGGALHFNINETYEFGSEIYIEKDGFQYDMKLHPPFPEVKSSMYYLVDSIVNNTPHIATGEEGLIVMEIIDAIYKSATKGRPLKIK
ncbi:MAG: 1,5-anhydro-D-fructose reductase [candidate division WS2 bacterium]|uniref:1,5-anhydro-D-fructose reductase n=1 Tax=Psychracetigena formicireducens TaxID=2986056 RepID=A0A9E2F742_PSYF1|nr:1,5-anhydro-D-fructose reductase [Candidatus Psychracetigena formicireducens]